MPEPSRNSRLDKDCRPDTSLSLSGLHIRRTAYRHPRAAVLVDIARIFSYMSPLAGRKSLGLLIREGGFDIYYFILQRAETEGVDCVIGFYVAAAIHGGGYRIVYLVRAGNNGIEQEARVVFCQEC